MFHFKQFSINDDKSTMKVGTDAVLLGAIAEVNVDTDNIKILDIGCGCGVISLMMAQRFPQSLVTAIDLDAYSIEQASENFADSPFSSRLITTCSPIQDFIGESFDLIISNPPFFENSLKAPGKQRSLARHNDTLSFEDLLSSVTRLLKEDGTFVGILPCEAAEKVKSIADKFDLSLSRQIKINNRTSSKDVRTIFFLQKNDVDEIIEEHHSIRDDDNSYSKWYRELTADFYTHLK